VRGMPVAVIADIHGNVDALKAVVGDVSARRADRIVNLGDGVSGPLWPREPMDLLQAMDLPTVRGHHDRWVAPTPRAETGPADAFAHDQRRGKVTLGAASRGCASTC
jgi:predicted phosphodiesterase